MGSSSVKASLVDIDSGECAASAFYPFEEAPIKAVKAGWTEQDPDMWWANAKPLEEISMFWKKRGCR